MEKGNQILAILVVFLVLSWIAFLVRMFTRICIKRDSRGDDIVLLVSAATFAIMGGFLGAAINAGFGKHAADLSPTALSTVTKFYFCSTLAYIISTAFAKVAYGIALTRIEMRKCHTWVLRIVLGIITAATIFYFFWFLQQCNPIAFTWTQHLDPPPAGGKCFDRKWMANTAFIHGAFVMATNWSLLILSFKIIKDMDAENQARGFLFLLAALGSVAGISSIAQFPYFHFLESNEGMYHDAADLEIWRILETSICIIVTSAIKLKPLLVKAGYVSEQPSLEDALRQSPWRVDREPSVRDKWESWIDKQSQTSRRTAGTPEAAALPPTGRRSAGSRGSRSGSMEMIAWDNTGVEAKSTTTTDIRAGGAERSNDQQQYQQHLNHHQTTTFGTTGIERKVEIEVSIMK